MVCLGFTMQEQQGKEIVTRRETSFRIVFADNYERINVMSHYQHLSITVWPRAANDRSEQGHWEKDTAPCFEARTPCLRRHPPASCTWLLTAGDNARILFLFIGG